MKIMDLLKLSGLACIPVIAVLLHGNSIAAGQSKNDAVKILRSDGGGVSIRYLPGKMEKVEVKSDKLGTTYDRISLEGGYSVFNPGNPSLPAKNFFIALPPGSNPTVRVSATKSGQRFSRLKTVDRIDESALSTTVNRSVDALSGYKVGRIRNLDVLQVTVSAAKYDAVSKSAVGYNQIDINVSFNAPNNPKTRPMGEDRFSQRIFPHLLS
ncbi:MAG: hypothetical protein GF307_06400, partial [candidate division Zixibacteria bacterium]|nr:hypothetical protein [candidate division Zixibacteria bacterium]